MKYILSIALCILYACCLEAQPKSCPVMLPKPRMDANVTSCVDTAYIRVSYALNADDVDDLATYIDWQCLEIGHSVSKYYSKFLHTSDSLFVHWRKKHPSAKSMPYWLSEGGKNSDRWSEYQFSEIFRAEREATVYVRMPMFLDRYNCQYTEPYPQQQWILQKDTLTICGQLCQKATCSYHGRDFEAWFAPGIPIEEGPWTFGGLPGLILKVYDKDRLYDFECVGIEQGIFPIRKYDYRKYKPMNRSKVLEFLKKINENYFTLLGAVDNSGKMSSKHTPYEPLELE